MPRRTDIESICVIGSGPIVIGQACEFDYAGCQALKVLREEGYRTIVVNSNPATIMTDPGFADRTYIEPLDLEGVASVLERERPDALLPTLGGQTALNLAIALSEAGILDDLGVELIGAQVDVIRRAEDRELFRDAVLSCGLVVPASWIVTSLAQLDGVPIPAVVRPAFTLGGHGGGFAEDRPALEFHVERGLWESPIGQVLVEESVRGWDEFELEVMRDHADNVVIVCSIENLDPMGVHTGDSVTVAPQMTLSDEAYQELRDAAVAIIRAVGVETGGSNIQFARSRETGELRIIEMNPRVSRSSALASKATGYPIAKVAAKLAVGYTLDEIPNDLTKTTPASFEPTLDYVVVKFPRFAFEKFPGADQTLGTQMKSVGEAMGIGRTFSEALLKAHGSRELERGAATPWPTLDDHDLPDGLHPWFRSEIARAREILDSGDIEAAKRAGWGDDTLGEALGLTGRGGASPASRARHPSGVPARRFVCRRGGRGVQLPVFDVGGRGRGAADGRQAARRHPRLGAEPDRAGHRVRLLLRPRRPDVPGAGLRGGDGQLQPRDRLDRLRHLGPPLFRASLAGGGARRLRPRAACRCRHSVRRADAVAARSCDRGGRLPHPRNAPRGDRPRRGPRALRPARRRAGRPLSAVGDGLGRLRGAGRRRGDRLSAPRASLVRPRRAGDAHLLRRRAARGRNGCRAGHRAPRPVRGERDRARRRRPLRRNRRVHRRGHAARRGGRRALGRFRVRAARPVADTRRCPRGRARREAARPGARCRRDPQRPAGDRRLDGLRARGEPASVTDGPVCEQGDRHRISSMPPAGSLRARPSPSSTCPCHGPRRSA